MVPETAVEGEFDSDPVTYAIMCQAGKGYSLWLSNSHEQEHPDATACCDD